MARMTTDGDLLACQLTLQMAADSYSRCTEVAQNRLFQPNIDEIARSGASVESAAACLDQAHHLAQRSNVLMIKKVAV